MAATVRDWLSSALPNAPFVHVGRQRVTTSGRSMYSSLCKSIKIQGWPEAEDLHALEHLGAELNLPLRDGLAATRPVILDAHYVLAVEANLQHFFDLSLIYSVNLALHCICQTPIVILPHMPFTQPTIPDDSIFGTKNFTPDYTVFKGNIGERSALLTTHDTILAVGDVKFYGSVKDHDHITHTDALSLSDLGQVLYYCVGRRTRFGFCVSDAELVFMEFVVDNNDHIEQLNNAVARAESELSSPLQEISLRGKRRYAGSTTGSSVSPCDRHQHKRSAANPDTDADAELLNSHAPASSSPSLPSSLPQPSSPRTPEHEPRHAYSSDEYVPSSSSEISPQTLKDLVSAGDSVTVRLHSFPISELEHWAPALFGFITLAQRVDAEGKKGISSTPISIRDYSTS